MAYEVQYFFPDEPSPDAVMSETLSALREQGLLVEIANRSEGVTWCAGELHIDGVASGISVEVHSDDVGVEAAWRHASTAPNAPTLATVTGLGILTLSGDIRSNVLESLRTHWIQQRNAIEFDEVDGFHVQDGDG